MHVVIIGLDDLENTQADKRLFSYPDINGEPEETGHTALSPYLFDAGGLADPHLVVREESHPINGMAKLIIGSKPIDGGNYIFNTEERAALLSMEPDAARPSCARLSAPTNICKVEHAGFLRCTTHLRQRWRGYHISRSALPRSARTVRPARACLRESWPKHRRSIM